MRLRISDLGLDVPLPPDTTVSLSTSEMGQLICVQRERKYVVMIDPGGYERATAASESGESTEQLHAVATITEFVPALRRSVNIKISFANYSIANGYCSYMEPVAGTALRAYDKLPSEWRTDTSGSRRTVAVHPVATK